MRGPGVLQLLDWAPRILVGDGVASGGTNPQLNTSVASVVSFSAAAGDAPPGLEVITKETFKLGANLSQVRSVLAKGGLWFNVHPENDGGGVETDAACGIRPSPALEEACERETTLLLAHPSAANAVRHIVPRGVRPCAFAKRLYADGSSFGGDHHDDDGEDILGGDEVHVDAVDVTAALKGPLRSASSGRAGAYAVEHRLVILTWPNGSRAMLLLHLGEYHPSKLAECAAGHGLPPAPTAAHRLCRAVQAAALGRAGGRPARAPDGEGHQTDAAVGDGRENWIPGRLQGRPELPRWYVRIYAWCSTYR